MDVFVTVLWEDDRQTKHCITNMPDEAMKVAQERLEQDLADYLPDEEWPLDADGLPLAWVSVTVTKRSS